jgi:hypothetical protein
MKFSTHQKAALQDEQQACETIKSVALPAALAGDSSQHSLI